MWSNSDCASFSFTCSGQGTKSARASAKQHSRGSHTRAFERGTHLRDVGLDQVGAQQTHAAVDVEADAT
jgi:SLT domain-containing protein